MTSFEQEAHYWVKYREAQIREHKESVRNLLLGRMVVIAMDSEQLTEYMAIVENLASELKIDTSDAYSILRPVATTMYAAAKAVCHE